jgi:hypothetical protein
MGQPEKICHGDSIAGLPSTAEMVADGEHRRCDYRHSPSTL